MWSFPKRANFECYSGNEFPDKSIQKFGFDFEAKGNFSFSWEQAVYDNEENFLCGPYYLIVKELTRRMQYNAIPFYVIQDYSSKFDLVETDNGMFIEKVIEKELDLFINFGFITKMMSLLGKMSVPGTAYEPLITILGSKYPNNKRDHYYALTGIFDTNIWLLMFMSALVLTLITSLSKSFEKKGNCLHNWPGEIWNIFKIICLKNFHPKFKRKLLYLTYSLMFLSSLSLLNAFSSLILSRTIQKDFTIINNLNQLLVRDDIQPFTILHQAELLKIKRFGSEKVKSIIEKSIANNAMETKSDLIDLAIKASELRTKLKTHCILSTRYSNQLLKGDDENLYYGREMYFEMIVSFFYSKDTEPLLYNTLEKLLYDIIESDLRNKWTTEALDFGWKFWAEKQESLQRETRMFTLSNLKIASGPLYFGYLISVMILILEKVTSDCI